MPQFDSDEDLAARACNARIERVDLGYNDDQVFSVSLHLRIASGPHLLFGAYELDEFLPEMRIRLGIPFGVELLKRILVVAGAESWGSVAGMYVRAVREGSSIVAIGHILDEVWLYPAQLFAALQQPRTKKK